MSYLEKARAALARSAALQGERERLAPAAAQAVETVLPLDDTAPRGEEPAITSAPPYALNAINAKSPADRIANRFTRWIALGGLQRLHQPLCAGGYAFTPGYLVWA